MPALLTPGREGDLPDDERRRAAHGPRTLCRRRGGLCGKEPTPIVRTRLPTQTARLSAAVVDLSLVKPLCVLSGGRRFLYCLAYPLSQRPCLPVTGGADVRFARHVSVRLSGIRRPRTVYPLPGGAAARRSVQRTAWRRTLCIRLPCLSLTRQPARAGADLPVGGKNGAHLPGKCPAPRNAHHPDAVVSATAHSRTSLMALRQCQPGLADPLQVRRLAIKRKNRGVEPFQVVPRPG